MQVRSPYTVSNPASSPMPMPNWIIDDDVACDFLASVGLSPVPQCPQMWHQVVKCQTVFGRRTGKRQKKACDRRQTPEKESLGSFTLSQQPCHERLRNFTYPPQESYFLVAVTPSVNFDDLNEYHAVLWLSGKLLWTSIWRDGHLKISAWAVWLSHNSYRRQCYPLKNPIRPSQITSEHLQRHKSEAPDVFEFWRMMIETTPQPDQLHYFCLCTLRSQNNIIVLHPISIFQSSLFPSPQLHRCCQEYNIDKNAILLQANSPY